MKIDISEIMKKDGASLEVSFNGEIQELDRDESGFLFRDPVSFHGQLTNSEGVLKLDGKLNATYTVKCYRCLKEVAGSIDLPIREDFMTSEKQEESNADVYTYEGKFIELDGVLRDNMVLNLPMKTVCSEACRGLCPKCGVDLNQGSCGCREDDINPRMTKLEGFFKN